MCVEKFFEKKGIKAKNLNSIPVQIDAQLDDEKAIKIPNLIRIKDIIFGRLVTWKSKCYLG